MSFFLICGMLDAAMRASPQSHRQRLGRVTAWGTSPYSIPVFHDIVGVLPIDMRGYSAALVENSEEPEDDVFKGLGVHEEVLGVLRDTKFKDTSTEMCSQYVQMFRI